VSSSFGKARMTMEKRGAGQLSHSGGMAGLGPEKLVKISIFFEKDA